MKFSANRSQRKVPGLNTSSLPDLIFTVLFFFMIVTHMRKVTLKVQYQVPAGTELTKLTKKSATTYLYIGKNNQHLFTPRATASSNNSEQQPRSAQESFAIQLNDRVIPADEVTDYVAAERNRMRPEDINAMTVSIKADRKVPMGLVTDIKQSLRNANALRINYSATERKRQR